MNLQDARLDALENAEEELAHRCRVYLRHRNDHARDELTEAAAEYSGIRRAVDADQSVHLRADDEEAAKIVALTESLSTAADKQDAAREDDSLTEARETVARGLVAADLLARRDRVRHQAGLE